MTTRRFRFLMCLLGLWTVGAAGCESGFILDAAQQSLASFAVSVTTTAINETIGP